MPWAVGASELVASPPARARVHGLGRLTAPTHSPWFWLVLWIATAAAGFVAQIPALIGRRPAGAGERGAPQPLRRLLRGVRPHRVAQAPGQRGRTHADGHGIRRPAVRDPGSGRLAARVHARPAVRRAVDRALRRADPELRDRRPAHDEDRRGPRRRVHLRALRHAVRRAAVPAGRAQPAARVARRRHRERAHQGPVGRPGRRGARRRGRDRPPLARGVASTPARAAPEPRRQPVRRAVCREPHDPHRGLAVRAAHDGS